MLVAYLAIKFNKGSKVKEGKKFPQKGEIFGIKFKLIIEP